MKRSIGIDLGTTNSCVATVDESGKPSIIANKLGESTTPSTVSLRSAPGSGGEPPLVGAPAMRRAATNPSETLYGVKRLIGPMAMLGSRCLERNFRHPKSHRWCFANCTKLPKRILAIR